MIKIFVKILEDMTDSPAIVSTRKPVVDDKFIRKSSILCKSILGIDGSRLEPFQYTKIYQQDCTRDGILTPICRKF